MKTTIPEETINRSQSRVFRYWLEDGMGELCVGLSFLLGATLYYFQETAPGSLLSRILGIASFVLIFGAAIGGRRLIQWIKERTTYPHTGYVAYKSGWKNKGDIAIAISLLVLILAFVVFTTVTKTQLANWGPVVGGLLVGIILAQIGYRSASPRLYILAFLGLLIGAGLVISGLSLTLSLPLFFGLDGLILFVSGGVTFWKYLHRQHASLETSDEQ